MPFEGAPPLQPSTIDISFSFTRTELLEMMRSLPGVMFLLPYPQDGSEFAASINFVAAPNDALCCQPIDIGDMTRDPLAKHCATVTAALRYQR